MQIQNFLKIIEHRFKNTGRGQTTFTVLVKSIFQYSFKAAQFLHKKDDSSQNICVFFNITYAWYFYIVTSVECNRASGGGYLTEGFQPVVLVLLPALLVIGYSAWAGEENESAAFLAGARCQLWIFHLWTCRCLARCCFAFYKVWSISSLYH